MTEKYLNPTQASGRDLILRNIQGPVVMLNLLRFRKIADYSETPGISPLIPISGEEAYHFYIGQALPHLLKSGGEILFLGKGGSFLIGPVDEQWDEVMLIKQNSVSSFMSFASNAAYINCLGHRTAALEDSRLLPLVEYSYKH
ncbi:MAG: hypothetical protein ABIP35_17135 [Ginsengibacter sp.]